MAAVIGSPDKVRTEIVKAFIVLKPEVTSDKTLEEEIKSFVKNRLAAHEYPREVEFIDTLPLTATGKIIRKDLRELEKQRKGKI
jgi:acetyl-CoA synthetase